MLMGTLPSAGQLAPLRLDPLAHDSRNIREGESQARVCDEFHNGMNQMLQDTKSLSAFASPGFERKSQSAKIRLIFQDKATQRWPYSAPRKRSIFARSAIR
ncbi:hypothetical protein FVE85_6969 [Porphyridium purpureum]|uniref:Uncharacterized protein n=1 Tax=Porphyridium purpureum TaxID=35688 RepID=A0A5J4Z8R8_PORPP|nr:hypothetical protein FVE85_6969 [Porphyridium purpureum]|eukprot:POR5118..scf295_1